MQLGDKLKAIRLRSGMTLVELSTEAGVSKSMLSRIERNDSAPDHHHAREDRRRTRRGRRRPLRRSRCRRGRPLHGPSPRPAEPETRSLDPPATAYGTIGSVSRSSAPDRAQEGDHALGRRLRDALPGHAAPHRVHLHHLPGERRLGRPLLARRRGVRRRRARDASGGSSATRSSSSKPATASTTPARSRTAGRTPATWRRRRSGRSRRLPS